MAAHAKRLSLQGSTQGPPAHFFPTSRPIRPFPSIANSLARPATPGSKGSNGAPGRKPTKLIQPPANFKSEFVLDLTQAELGRQD